MTSQTTPHPRRLFPATLLLALGAAALLAIQVHTDNEDCANLVNGNANALPLKRRDPGASDRRPFDPHRSEVTAPRKNFARREL